MNSNGIQGQGLNVFVNRFRLQRGLAFGVLIIAALVAFEIFNYSTTDYALRDLLGDLRFAGVPWATILAIAFCGIDFAGIARLFTPEEGMDEPAEVWYLFGAWLLAATMNALLTWWGVSLAILNHETLGNAVIARATLLRVVPIFVAVMVWLIRVLVIGTFSVAGDRLFSQALQPYTPRMRQYSQPLPPPSQQVRSLGGGASRQQVPAAPRAVAAKAQHQQPAASSNFRPAPKPTSMPPEAPNGYNLPDPTYHPMNAAPNNNPNSGNGNGYTAPAPRNPTPQRSFSSNVFSPRPGPGSRSNNSNNRRQE